ncbi:hypothetical protein [Bacillus thuringiensis]|uniref:Uncharacterized protein n=1 Tax=Bacillus thuringiensis TaxID=1428 RepID=A0A9X6ZSJ8_BACTU|nr:hypothetical protein [Bacillus thuringiensis]PFJ38826.1 hypothetical protein COJ15_17260 [Bacillus thuringiensis]
MQYKETILNNINHFIQEHVIPNKLEIIATIDMATELEFDNLKLVDIYFDEATTHIRSTYQNTYTTLVHVFQIGQKTVELSIDENISFEGIYPLDNYNIHFSQEDGTQIDLFDENFVDFGLHEYLNLYEYNEIIGELNLIYKFKSESANNYVTELEDIKKCIPTITHIESFSIEKCILHFPNDVSMCVDVSEIKKTIEKYKQKNK